uniref:Uncharacterized protein n=1 Tax=Haemonchus contortus TaxID=6289 RepID=A0A7I4Z1E8_HAECO
MAMHQGVERFHAIMLRETTPPMCMMCLPRSVGMSVRLGEQQLADRWRKKLFKANILKVRRSRALKERLDAILKCIDEMEKEEEERMKMFGRNPWGRWRLPYQPEFETSWERVRRLDGAIETIRPGAH